MQNDTCDNCKKVLEFFPAYFIALDDPSNGEQHAMGTFCTQRCLREAMTKLYDEAYNSFQGPILTRGREYARRLENAT